MVRFVNIDNHSKPTCPPPSGCSNSPFSQCSVSIGPKDQIAGEPIRFTTPISLSRNQAIPATPAISVSTTPYSIFLLLKTPMLSSVLSALGTKMCGKIVITSYFSYELQSLKKIIMYIIDLRMTA